MFFDLEHIITILGSIDKLKESIDDIKEEFE